MIYTLQMTLGIREDISMRGSGTVVDIVPDNIGNLSHCLVTVGGTNLPCVLSSNLLNDDGRVVDDCKRKIVILLKIEVIILSMVYQGVVLPNARHRQLSTWICFAYTYFNYLCK